MKNIKIKALSIGEAMPFSKMGSSLCLLLSILFFLHSSTSLAQFSATTSSTTVAVGDQFQVTFTVQGNGSNFHAPGFPDFNTLVGPNQSTSMQIMNGSVSQTISFTYVLQAVKEGAFTIQPATLEMGGKKLQSNALTITVVKGSTPPPSANQHGGGNQQGGGNDAVVGGKNVFLKVGVDKTNVWQGEGIIVTYKLYTKVNLVNYAISKVPSFDGFWSQEIQLPQQLQFHKENYDGVAYNVADIKKFVLFPQRSGALMLEPMEGEVVAQVQVKRQQGRDPFDQFFNDPFFNNPFFGNVQNVKVALKSDPIKITSRELPPNAPASFTGAVGSFSMDASLDKTETKAHDAVTLKIKVVGKGNVKLIEAPKINFPAEFESYDPKINTNISTSTGGVTGSKAFEYLIIPRNAGEYKIPVSGFSYFDLEKKKYVSIEGKEFLLKVAKGAESPVATVTGVSKSDIQFLGKDIRFIKTAVPSFVQSDRVLYNTPVFYSLMVAPALMFVFLLGFRKRYSEMHSNVTLMRSRRANKVAKKRLSAAKKFLADNNREAFLDEMFRALWGFVSDKLQIPVSDLTKENVAQALAARNVSKESSDLFIQSLDACELARFAPGVASGIEEIYQKGIGVISKIEEEIKDPLTSKGRSTAVVALLLLFSSAAFAVQSPGIIDPSAEFSEANILYQKLEYDSAVKIYEKLTSQIPPFTDGGAVYYNLGNCYYKTGNTAKAIVAYERALKLNPDDEDALFNLHVAQLKVVDKIEPVPQIFYKRWVDSITGLFSVKVWSEIMLALLWIAFFFAAAYVLSRSPSVRQLMFIISVVFVFLTITAWFFSHQNYLKNEVEKSAIVNAASAYVKSSPDEKGNDLFIIHEGTKVDLLDEFGEWKKIRIANGSVGWMKNGEIEEI